MTYEDALSMPSKDSATIDLSDHVVSWVLDLWDPGRVGTRGCRVLPSRGTLTQRLVRPLLIVLLSKNIESLLLPRTIECRWPRRFGLEGPVHPFVAAIVLGVMGTTPNKPDPQFDPPHGQFREPSQPCPGERSPVVTTDCPRQSVLPQGL